MSSPIQQSERSSVVDVLRGFALGGVIIANLASFVTFVSPAENIEAMTTFGADKVYDFIMGVFVDNKFITLFSLLFGYGFGVIMERVGEKGIDTTVFFFRRMSFLLLAGIAHLFVWWGEVLHAYALCGMVLLLFRKASNKALIIWAVIFFIVPPVIFRYAQIVTNAYSDPQKELAMGQYLASSLSHDVRAIFSGNWDLYHYVFISCFGDQRELPEILAKFLIGYYVLRSGVLKRLDLNLPRIKKVFWICLPLAVLYLAEMTAFRFWQPMITVIPLRLVIFSLTRMGILSLSVCYACIIIFAYHKFPRAKVLSAFRYVGMMSLTNYVTHTLIFIVLLNGIGFGLMGSMHLIYSLLIAIAIYIAQAFFSKWWMERYQYGPVEWVWRQLSYWKKLSIRKPVSQG